ncbi:hypothetical protein DXG01_001984 [Tephrocybe rancida]|nr:hypothetical protein DXG01_001984 [Tephrocybe rancida]
MKPAPQRLSTNKIAFMQAPLFFPNASFLLCGNRTFLPLLRSRCKHRQRTAQAATFMAPTRAERLARLVAEDLGRVTERCAWHTARSRATAAGTNNWDAAWWTGTDVALGGTSVVAACEGLAAGRGTGGNRRRAG